jgi:hypothetical protein
LATLTKPPPFIIVLPSLQFPAYPIRIRKSGEKTEVFDPIRQQWYILTPEEWVRQHVLHFLIQDKKYPSAWLAVEKAITVNGLRKRCDIVAYTRDAKPSLLVECKAPDILITQHTFDQVARYNMRLGVDLLFLTNGIQHFCCRINHQLQRYKFIPELPEFLG